MKFFLIINNKKSFQNGRRLSSAIRNLLLRRCVDFFLTSMTKPDNMNEGPIAQQENPPISPDEAENIEYAEDDIPAEETDQVEELHNQENAADDVADPNDVDLAANEWPSEDQVPPPAVEASQTPVQQVVITSWSNAFSRLFNP